MMAIWNGTRWYAVVVLNWVPLISWGSFCYVQVLESFYHKHLLNYIKKNHQLLRWSYGFHPSVYIDVQLLSNISISGINRTLNKHVQSFYGIAGFFVLLVFCWAYLSLFIYVILVFSFIFLGYLVVGIRVMVTCRMSFGFLSTLEFWKSFRTACASSSLTGS